MATGKSHMWCEVVTAFDRLEELAPAWRERAASDGRSDIFQQWEWMRAFWKAYSHTVELCCPVVHSGAGVVGILPLVRRGRVLEFLGSPASDYNDVLCDEHDCGNVLSTALSALLDPAVSWDTCVLDNLSSDSRIARHVEALPHDLRRRVQRVGRAPSPAIVVQGGAVTGWQAVVDNGRIATYDRKLQKLGRVTFRHIETPDEARVHMAEFIRQHISRSAVAGMKSHLLASERRSLYFALIESLDLRMDLRFGVLELDNRPVAYHLGFQRNGKFIYYTPTFDVNYWDSNLGDILLRRLFEYCRDVRLSEFDFSIGDEPYKSRFATHCKENQGIYIDRHPRRPGAAVKRIVRAAEETIRQRPALKRAIKSTVSSTKQRAIDIRQKLTGSELRQGLPNALRNLRRNALWLRTDVLLFSGSSPAEPNSPAQRLAPATLDALAALSVEQDGFPGASLLREARLRLKKGDRGFILRLPSGAVVVWTGSRSQISIPRLRCNWQLPAPQSVLLAYDVWMWPRSLTGRDLARALHTVGLEVGRENFWLWCFEHDTAMRRGIENAGFELRYRFTHHTFLRWFQRTRIQGATNTDERIQPEASEESVRAGS